MAMILFISGGIRGTIEEWARAEMEDTQREKPVLERKREWQHGDQGQGKNCGRAQKPIFTKPSETPGICRGWTCDNQEWYSKGIVIRDKSTKQIIHREK